MLALRLALDGGGTGPGDPDRAGRRDGDGPATMIFDEVDAGIGGRAATAVGAALARLAADRQVLVVTHLAQVAAWGDAQVSGHQAPGRRRHVVAGQRARRAMSACVELARMLSGSPESASARQHAAELLGAGRRSTGRGAHRRIAGRRWGSVERATGVA